MIDLHCHILPGVDDGAKDIEIALDMLEAEKENGVSDVVLTPHFYFEEERPSKFIEKTRASYDCLKSQTNGKDYPNLYLGAEVLFTPSLASIDLKPFCIENTNYMLLELPYKKLNDRLLTELRNFIDSVDVNIIIAHVERYLNFTSEESVLEVMSMNVLNQINCTSFLKMSAMRKKLIKWISNEMVHFLGTDAHNLVSRPVCLKQAYDYIEKKVPNNSLMENAALILQNKDIF